MKQRLDKVLAEAGIGSRKEVSRLIRKKKVFVNGELVRDPSFKVDPEKDKIEVEGSLISPPRYGVCYRFYKPVGYVSSHKDPLSPTIMELLPPSLQKKRLFIAGRLDKDAEGLLLLSDDGELVHRITHPRWKCPKVYEVVLEKPLEEEAKTRLETGVELKEGKTMPCEISFLDEERKRLKIKVYEGRHHLLKRIFKKVGNRVLKIKRLAIGPITLEGLKEGEVEELSKKELFQLKKFLNLE
jgi:pseudouridine synthase